MASELVMPPLSQTTDEVKLVGWLVKEGDTIQKGEAVCEVETDKVSMEVESFTAGTILKILAEPDSVVRVGTAIAIVGAAGEEVSQSTDRQPQSRPAPQPKESRQVSHIAGQAATLSPVAQDIAAKRGLKPDGIVGTGLGGTVTAKDIAAQTDASLQSDSRAQIKATRMVRHFAEKRGIDLSSIDGTGPKGLITRDDVSRYQAEAIQAAGEPESSGVASRQPAGPLVSEETDIALTQNQMAIAYNLSKSKSEIPHYYLKTTLYMERLLSYRASHPYPDGKKVSLTALLVRAAALALSRHPRLNGYFRENTVHLYGSIGIAVAVASGDELYVPVVREPLSKEIREIDKEISWLAAKARNGRLEADDLRGGTFTVSNLGMYPVDEFAAIISPKQAGILAVGRMEKKMVIGEDDAIRIRPAVTVTGSFDHRVVNGVQGGEFLGTLKHIAEEELT